MKPMGSNLPRSLLACAVFLLSVTLLTAWAEAQARQDRPELQETITVLQLSPQQETDFIAIMDDYRDSMQLLMERYGVDPSEGRPPLRVMMAMRKDLQSNRQEMEQRMSAVLTPAQMRTFKQMQETARREIRNGL